MKIWNNHGSEHSASLVMIGTFLNESSAEKAKQIIDEITEYMTTHNDDHREAVRYSDDVMDLLRKVGWYDVAPMELVQFSSEISSKQKGNQLIIRTDENDVSAFLKLMVDKGARVEVYSTHTYPEESGKAGD